MAVIDPGGRVSAWPLVGREEEIAFLEDVLARPGSPGAVISGAAGVGKTRLGREILRRAADVAATEWITATRAAGRIPFGAFAHLLPVLEPDPGGLANVLRAAAHEMISRLGDKSLVLGVDDAHLLDDSSAALVHHLILSGRTRVLCVVRTGERAPEPITSLWKDEFAERLELQPLSRLQVEQLLIACLGGQVETSTVHRLWEACRGSPLILHELVLTGTESGALTVAMGVWRWDGMLTTSTRLRELIELRLEALDPNDRRTLEVLAIVESIELDLLLATSSLESLERLERASVVEEVRAERRTRIRLAHPLYGNVVRDTTPGVRRRTAMGQLADAIERAGARRREDLLRLVTWRLDAGRPSDPAVLLKAARRARAAFAHELTERLARELEAEQPFEAGFLMAESLQGQRRFSEADAVFSSLETGAHDDAQRVRATIGRTRNLLTNLGTVQPALDTIRRSEEHVTDPSAGHAIKALRAQVAMTTGRAREAIDTGRSLLNAADVSPQGLLLAVRAVAGASVYGARGREGIEVLDRGIERLSTMSAGVPESTADVYRFLAMYLTGRFKHAARFAEARHQQAIDSGLRWATGIWVGARGSVALARGEIESAAGLLREGRATFGGGEIAAANQLAPMLSQLAQAYALLELGDEARTVMAAAEEMFSPAAGFARGFLAQARTWVIVAGGEISNAVGTALSEARLLDEMGLHAHQAWLLHDVVRLGDAPIVVDTLDHLARTCEGPLIPVMAMHARAATASDAALLAKASEGFEDDEIGATLLAAEAAAESAKAYEREGSRGKALAMRKRSEMLAARCQGARTPALRGNHQALPLTRREREIAALAARGLSNREIASRLTVSVRTVDNHLHTVYSKLGVAGRADLVGIFGRDQPSAS